jgi:uncharacterized protein YjbJ (UPF0337 family)
MHKEQSNGRWTQFKGELRHWGKFTDDNLLQIEGDYQKFEGTLPGKYGDQKENVSRWADQWFKSTIQMPRSDAHLEEVI